MNADPEVKMISAEAPILFAKGCDIFITELTMRAWIHAEENKRRTLQRSDIASALAKSDMFDFLIDIVPREEATAHAKRTSGNAPPQGAPSVGPQIPPQNIPQQGPPQHMPPPDYTISHGLQAEDYRNQGNMYTTQVQPGPPAPYGAPGPQMYNEMEGIYGYPTMQAQQVCIPSWRTFYSQFATNIASQCTMYLNNVLKIHPVAKIQATIIRVMMGKRVTLMLREREIMKSDNGRSGGFRVAGA